MNLLEEPIDFLDNETPVATLENVRCSYQEDAVNTNRINTDLDPKDVEIMAGREFDLWLKTLTDSVYREARESALIEARELLDRELKTVLGNQSEANRALIEGFESAAVKIKSLSVS